ncbi:MAG: translation initiation factor IF-3 [Chlamydiae bacterium CG10_big_fil_rev_8_21_14_0_10_35_9]|nr:MAG: translation initiation factor IF-3 [Chlamydiae bacterium CG10_big_fil_rev_8_21_14_0_10_35_9]
MRVNRQIRTDKVRVISEDGSQLGILTVPEAIRKAEEAGLDLVEIAPKAKPPVCKIIDYGKYRYLLTKKEKESKKSQHQIKVKEVKLKPNIDVHDLNTKLKRARDFLEKGNKVKITCMFRGREMLHMNIGYEVVKKFCEDLSDVGSVEAPTKQMGRTITTVLAPQSKKNK